MKVCPVCHREYASGVTNCSEDGVPLVGLHTDANLRPEELVGRIIEGRYKIERIIGKGGMGTVYACRHVVVGKVAAMKVLRTGVERSDGVLQRFVREAQTANLLRSRHIVEVSDFGQLPNGAFFVVMELLEGHDLAHAMRHGLNRGQLVHVFSQVAETLQVAHDKGIVHRDLKPDNVFLVTEGSDSLFVKLLDFGIAKVLHGEGNGGLTETGVILGTPYYMSPEQARAEGVDHRTDIYSLGVMMYRAFTGRLPFVADSTMGVLTRHITEAPEAPSRLVPMDAATERLILRCMSKHKEDRFQTMYEVLEALKQVPTGAVTPIAEHTTVYDGPIGRNAPSAAFAAVTGSQQAAATGAHGQQPIPSGAYPQASVTGGYVRQSLPQSGHQVPAAPSGAFAAASSGSYAATPQVASQATGMPQASLPAIHPASTSGAFAAASGNFPSASGAFAPASGSALGTSGAYGAPTSAPFDPRTGNPAPFDPRVSAGAAGYSVPPGNSETARGLAATGAIQMPRPASNTTTLILGAVAMLSLGALGAVLLFRGRPPAADTPTTSAPATNPPPSASATAPVTATAAPSPVPSATPSTTAEASAVPAAVPPARPQTKMGGPAPKAAPSATATAGAKRTPRDIRSPFD